MSPHLAGAGGRYSEVFERVFDLVGARRLQVLNSFAAASAMRLTASASEVLLAPFDSGTPLLRAFL